MHREVRTASGALRGRREGDVAVFRGIRYAEPPVGPRRFAAPVPAARWSGTRDALAFGAAPGTGSGDWLTLAVWTPDPGRTALPVLVWISGGAYLQCDTANPHLDGAELAAAGAVVVAVNYRVGVEGFAHLGGAPDNRGILDQLAALRWVGEHVAAFGGDPDAVTVFGESAGAGSIAALLTMPGARGLFGRAVVQSLPGTYLTPRLAADVTATIAAGPGTGTTAAELARFPPDAVVRATAAVVATLPGRAARWGPIALTSTPFAPVVDGEILTRAPWAALQDGAAAGVELLVGHTRAEFRLLAAALGDALTAAAPVVDAAVPGGLAAYPDATPDDRAEEAMADWLFRMPTLALADAQVEGGGRAFTYELTWGFGPEGATHGLDVLLLFGTVGDVLGGARNSPEVVAAAEGLARRMRADLLAFATTGRPGWPPHDTGLARVYDATTTTGPYPERESRRRWSGHAFDVLDLPG